MADDDFEAELLALAAGDDEPTKTSKRKKASSSSKRKRYSYTDDEEEEDDDDQGGYYSSDISIDDHSDQDDEDEKLLEKINQWGDDLMGNDQDRKRLLAMSEMERESILAERSETRQQVLERIQVKKKLRAADSSSRNATSSSSKRRSSRSKKGLDKKSRSLANLKSSRKNRNTMARYSDEDDDLSDEPEEGEQDDEVTRDDIETIQVCRDDCEKWCFATFFEDTVIGSFVRIALPTSRDKEPVYRVCYVTDVVDHHKIYTINSSTTVKKALEVTHGKAKKAFTMDVISNSPITQAEWDRYVKTIQKERLSIPKLRQIKAKAEMVKESREHIFTDEEIREMIKLKKSLKNRPINVATERLHLENQLDLATQEGDDEEVDRIKLEMEKLDTYKSSNTKNTEKLDAWADLNKKNRKLNTIGAQEVARQAKADLTGAGILKDEDQVDLIDGDIVEDDFFDRLDLSMFEEVSVA